MRKLVIKSKKTYTSGGEEKTAWKDVGMITEFDNGGVIVELNHLPNETFSAFPLEKKDRWDKSVPEDIKKSQGYQEPNEIDVNSIPF